jgi:hypothetical protein
VRRGQVSDAMLREFVAEMMADFERGRQLPADVTLAALATALESSNADFAEEYLCDLARLQLAEMPMSIRVARECLKVRCGLPKNEIRRFTYPWSSSPLFCRRPAVRSVDLPPSRPRRLRPTSYPTLAGAT